MKERYEYLDNLKGLCIILVVLGHFIEPLMDSSKYRLLYYIFMSIYAFHMPVFCFISGYVSKFKKSTTLYYLGTYMFINVVMNIFEYTSGQIHTAGDVIYNLLFPHYHTWYLFNLVFYVLSLKLIDKILELKNGKFIAYIILVLSLIAHVFVGLIDYTSILFIYRLINLYPFFLAGYLLKKSGKDITSPNKPTVAVAMLITSFMAVNNLGSLTIKDFRCVFFTDYYKTIGITPMNKFNMLLISTVCLVCLIQIFGYKKMAHRKIPILNFIGMNTMTIYVFHGIFAKWAYDILFGNASKYSIFDSVYARLAYGIICMIICVTVFSLKPFRMLNQKIKQIGNTNQKQITK